MILSVAMMVRWLGDKQSDTALQAAGDLMVKAVDQVLASPASRTRDLGGSMGCNAFGLAVSEAVAALAG
jgi:3-isopropylmalate dehydrogenase